MIPQPDFYYSPSTSALSLSAADPPSHPDPWLAPWMTPTYYHQPSIQLPLPDIEALPIQRPLLLADNPYKAQQSLGPDPELSGGVALSSPPFTPVRVFPAQAAAARSAVALCNPIESTPTVARVSHLRARIDKIRLALRPPLPSPLDSCLQSKDVVTATCFDSGYIWLVVVPVFRPRTHCPPLHTWSPDPSSRSMSAPSASGFAHALWHLQNQDQHMPFAV